MSAFDNNIKDDVFETIRVLFDSGYKISDLLNICRYVVEIEEENNKYEIHKYAHCLFNSFKELYFPVSSNKALQAFYLEDRLYVVKSESNGKYQYTLLEADSEEEAIRRCM